MKIKNKVLLGLALVAIFIVACSVDMIADFQFGIKMIPAIISIVYLVIFILTNMCICNN